MIQIGEAYRHKKHKILVEIKDVTPEKFILYLGYPKESCVYGRMILHKDKDTFIKEFYKLSSLEMELL